MWTNSAEDDNEGVVVTPGEPPDMQAAGACASYRDARVIDVYAGVLNCLIRRLTSPTNYDNRFVKTFIQTYQSFCDPWTLLNKLLERYNVRVVVRAYIGVNESRAGASIARSTEACVPTARVHCVEVSVRAQSVLVL
jgi:hypothetical protein